MKKWTAIILTLALAFCLFGCSAKEKTFETTGAESLVITSGYNGESITVTDAGDIKHITDSVCGLSYSRGDKVDSDGWSYSLKWVDKDGGTIEFLVLLGNGTVIYDDHYYAPTAANRSIDFDFIAGLFDSN